MSRLHGWRWAAKCRAYKFASNARQRRRIRRAHEAVLRHFEGRSVVMLYGVREARPS